MEFDRELLCVASLLHDVGLMDRFMGPRFELRTHASSVREFRDHWAVMEAYDPEEMEEALVRRQDEMYARSHKVLERSPGAELVYVEPATMTMLMPAG